MDKPLLYTSEDRLYFVSAGLIQLEDQSYFAAPAVYFLMDRRKKFCSHCKIKELTYRSFRISPLYLLTLSISADADPVDRVCHGISALIPVLPAKMEHLKLSEHKSKNLSHLLAVDPVRT